VECFQRELSEILVHSLRLCFDVINSLEHDGKRRILLELAGRGVACRDDPHPTPWEIVTAGLARFYQRLGNVSVG
jgi:hypothetical protein